MLIPCVGTVLLSTLLKERKNGHKDEEEDERSYSMTLRKREDTVFERASTRWQRLENSLWKMLWTCRKTDYVINK